MTMQAPCRADLRVISSIASGGGLRTAAVGAGGPAVRVGHRHPVDLGGERPEAVLVRHLLGGQRHREVGAAVVAVVDDHHGGPAGGGACDLHRVLHRFGAGVEQGRALLVVARGEPVQLLAHRHVALVGRDHEAGVGEAPTCSRTPATTSGAALPTLTTAIPEPRSISELPRRRRAPDPGDGGGHARSAHARAGADLATPGRPRRGRRDRRPLPHAVRPAPLPARLRAGRARRRRPGPILTTTTGRTVRARRLLQRLHRPPGDRPRATACGACSTA